LLALQYDIAQTSVASKSLALPNRCNAYVCYTLLRVCHHRVVAIESSILYKIRNCSFFFAILYILLLSPSYTKHKHIKLFVQRRKLHLKKDPTGDGW